MASKVINISIPEELLDAADRAAKAESRSRSELIREALRRYLDDAQWRRWQREAGRLAEAAGIRTEEDVVRAVHDLRGVPYE